ncbi:hypothetical protein E1B28_003402 [Marasmius oreades]|uniref:Uncharacterized protein n=1 Tax=Marasmius oreades TaxID=181124 RepID=A0A9P7RLS0_9AGAR|nr:uncharacterized protein E1B28_003402 [Marasmius oreades]KAG7085869.1 hypothetical protein E1B28_003402 [Marasmius oreades]
MSDNAQSDPQNPPQPYQNIDNQFNNTSGAPQNNETGTGAQHNYNADGQNINHGRDQNINSGPGQFYTGPQPLKDGCTMAYA